MKSVKILLGLFPLHSKIYALVEAWIALIACWSLLGVQQAFGENLALGAIYTIEPEAQYELTYDPMDRIQLTDGKYSTGQFWRSKSTVGWQGSKTIRIEIDLGQSSLVGSICVNTARGDQSGVSFPQRIDTFVSRDGNKYAYQGNLLQGQDHSDGAYQVVKYCSADRSTTTRYIWLFVQPQGPYTFIDEIEVLSSHGKQDKETLYNLRQEVIAQTQQDLTVVGHKASSLHYSAGRLLATLEHDTKKAPGGKQALGRIRALLESLFQSPPLDESAINRIADKVRLAHAEVQRERFNEAILIWHDNPWTTFTALDTPDTAMRDMNPLTLFLMRRGVSSEAVNLTNTSNTPKRIKIIAKVIPTGVGPVPSIIVREAVPIITAKSEIRADPLVQLPAGELVIQPGESKQIWLSVLAGESRQGTYTAELYLQSSSDDSPGKRVPVEIHTYSAEVPEQQRVMVTNWSYMNWRLIQTIKKRAIEDLIAHHTNIFVIHPSQLPWPRFSEGAWHADYTLFDNEILLYPKASKFLFFMNFNDPHFRKLGGINPFMSEQWKTTFRRWVKDWATHNLDLGMEYRNWALYPFDEPRNATEAKILFDVATIIKEVNPSIRVFTTLLGVPLTDLPRLAQVIDTFQILTNSLSEVRTTLLKGFKKELWSYTAEGGGKGAEPLGFYRNQAWKAFRAGATGIGFWAYADTGTSGTAWNDSDGARPDYSVVYEGDTDIISSKRWEAWREGVEDYELLMQAKKKLKDNNEETEFWHKIDEVVGLQNDYQTLQLTRRWLLGIASR